MLGDLAPQERADPVRPACAPFDVCTLERRRGDLLGRLSDALDYAWPLVGGAAAWLQGFGLIWLLQALKGGAEPSVVVAEP